METAFERKPVVYFTYGPCEPHGPHCAVGLDGLKAYEVAVAAAEVRWIHAKAEALLSEYSEEDDRPGFPTFADVERFWAREILMATFTEENVAAGSTDGARPQLRTVSKAGRS